MNDMRLYHGSTSLISGESSLLPPAATSQLSEGGRKKNLDRVFLTPDYGLAKIYAGRAANSLGGRPAVFECVVFDRDAVVLSDVTGATVIHASGAWIIGEVTV